MTQDAIGPASRRPTSCGFADGVIGTACNLLKPGPTSDKKEHFLVSGAGDEVGMNRKASIRAGDQKMVWTEPQALPWLWALHGRPRICWAVRPAHEGGIGGY